MLIKLASTTAGLAFASTPTGVTYYVRKDSVAYCPALKTNFVEIAVRPALTAGTIAIDTTICKAGKISLRGVTVPTEGKKAYTYTWELSLIHI